MPSSLQSTPADCHWTARSNTAHDASIRNHSNPSAVDSCLIIIRRREHKGICCKPVLNFGPRSIASRSIYLIPSIPLQSLES
jgi:hypothetical protein